MFTLLLDIMRPDGNTNLISTGRLLGEMGTTLTELKPMEASTINTFTKNILFTSLYINKQPNGNDTFQASFSSLVDTADQLMVLLSTGKLSALKAT